MRDNGEKILPEVHKEVFTPESIEAEFWDWRKKLVNKKEYKLAEKEEATFQIFFDKELKILINRLISEKERFGRIFQTKNGSVYFLLKSGESKRVKCKNGKYDEYSIQPLVKDIVFVGEQDQKEMLKKCEESYRRYDAVLGMVLEEKVLEKGVCPVEFNLYHYDRSFDTSLVREGSRFKIIASKRNMWEDQNYLPEDQRGQISNGIHIGNPITKIIK